VATLTQEIGGGVHRFADGIVNWYLIEDQGQLTLVDTGWPRSWPRIERAISDLGYSPADVAAVVLTHGHPDHLGGAEKARQECEAPVMAYSGEVARVRGEAKGSSPFAMLPNLIPELRRVASFKFVGEATIQGFMTPTWVKEVQPFEADVELDVPGRPKPLRTPGHTEGHVSLLLEGEGILIAGDALLTLNPLTREEGPCVPPPPVNTDTAQARRSLETIKKSNADTLLPGHGEPWRNGVAEAVARARERDASGS
jgi:glyoxylase-like metal-dependent hydrolase (beta-lactamase superfamily II)